MDTIYIPSYGRSEIMSTHKHFQRYGVDRWIYVVEPHDYANYVKALTAQAIENPEQHVLMFDVDTYKAPYHEFNNPKGFKYEDDEDWKEGLTTGPGPARNALIDFARERGETHLWMLDDDVKGFGVDAFHFQKGIFARGEERINLLQVFELFERLCEKYENLGLAEFDKSGISFNHKKNSHFSMSKTYTCIRINTAIDIPWRGRWNDDVIYSLDYLWRGYVNLSSKIISYQTPSSQEEDGGMNTKEGWAAQADSESAAELLEILALPGAIEEEVMKSDYRGTLAKAKLPATLFPAVASAVWNYSRPHHRVAYNKIPKDLILKDGANLDDLLLLPVIPQG